MAVTCVETAEAVEGRTGVQVWRSELLALPAGGGRRGRGGVGGWEGRRDDDASGRVSTLMADWVAPHTGYARLLSGGHVQGSAESLLLNKAVAVAVCCQQPAGDAPRQRLATYVSALGIQHGVLLMCGAGCGGSDRRRTRLSFEAEQLTLGEGGHLESQKLHGLAMSGHGA